MRRFLNWLLRRGRPVAAPEVLAAAPPPVTDAWSVLRNPTAPKVRTPAAPMAAAAPAAQPVAPPPAAQPVTPAPVVVPVQLATPGVAAAPAQLPKLIVYGNCQAAFLEVALGLLPAVRSRWRVVRHDVWDKGEKLEANLADFEDCDAVLVQEVRNWRTHPRRDNLPSKTRIVRYPFCYFAAMWPFDATQNGMDPNWVHEKGEREFGYADSLLARLRTEVPDPERRFASYRDLDMPDCVDIARYAEFEEARLLKLDRMLGYTVGRYIVDNYRKTRLFHAITHPAAAVGVKLVQEIMAKLGMHDLQFEREMPDILAFIQVPIHPLVIERLGLEWATLDFRYKFSVEESLTFDEYTRRYIKAYG